MKIKAIVAYTEKGRVIGDGDKIPWYLPEDFKHFKNTTINHPVIMGRKTWESLPKIALPSRENVVITSQCDKFYGELLEKEQLSLSIGPFFSRDLENAIKFCANKNIIWIIGGETIYKQALEQNIIDEVLATEVKKEYHGDKFFPELKGDWVSEVEFENNDFKIVRYKKVE